MSKSEREYQRHKEQRGDWEREELRNRITTAALAENWTLAKKLVNEYHASFKS